MSLRTLPRAGWLAACLVAVLAAPAAFALETASAVRGVVTDSNGAPVAGATVVIRNEATSLSRTVETGSDGTFFVRNLQVARTYSVTATGTGSEPERLENVALTLGRVTELSLVLQPERVMEEVVVVGSRSAAQVAVGPSATFGLDVLETVPAINRNITDVLRIDPRIYVDESRGGINAVQCAGKNSRFNSLTVDGVRTNDAFGLNSNGYPTERIPFSYDAINEVSVELAPFDAQYGGFTACNINAVTKSGGNEFFGSGFFDYTDDGLRGDSLEGDPIETGSFDETRWGLTLGGPIIKDKLFFFVAYEQLNGTNLFDRGPIGSGAVDEVAVTQAELDEIASIARDIYQYDPGEIPTSRPNDDEKLLVKFDWYISDQHRAAVTLNYNDGFNTVQSDGDLDEFEFSNHLYERGSELNSVSATLYSDWNERFSTQLRLGRLELDNRQDSIGGNEFGEIRVELDEVDVYLGGDDSRQANDLNYDVVNVSFTGSYQFDNHSFSFGYELEALDVFNLFVQHTQTEIRFDGIDNFRNGFADDIYYNNAPSNVATDAAADWGYNVNTLFVQDEFTVGDRLEVLVGLRYDWYSTNDAPLENPDFVADYGFSNSTNLDGEGLLQPRVGFTFYATETLALRGGVGLYAGGDPNVWLSNNFSANNVLQFGQRGRSFCYTPDFRGDCGPEGMEVQRSLFDDDVVYVGGESGVPNGPGYAIPQELFDAVASGTGDNFEINYLDPDFDLPSEWKFSLGATWEMPNDMSLDVDLLLTRGKDTAFILRGDLEQTGTNPDGYPEYDSVREPTFVLTNSGVGNEAFVASFALRKSFDFGLDLTVGYAYSDAEDVSPMTSSVAFSNYQNRAFFDPQEDVLSTSNYNTKHRFTFLANWQRMFFGDNRTSVSLYVSGREGPPYSIAFNGTIDPYGFTPFLDFRDNVLRPGVSRNAESGSWWTKADLRIEQEFGIGPTKAAAFIVVDNLTNLINDDWGVLKEVNFPNTVREGQRPESRVGDASRYEIRFGVRMSF
ncbi:MAG: TonB-dependent receptor [Pseudomonadota bacterium]